MVEHTNLNHFRFRAETIVDVINLRRALYELEKALAKLRRISKPDNTDSFKMAIVMRNSFPDVEVVLSTTYDIEFIRKTMLTIVDSHVMMETLTQYDNYTGERTYDTDILDIDVIHNIWSILQNTDDFYFRNITLTTENLVQKVMPYVQSLIEIQKIINSVRGIDFNAPQIRSIESGSISFSFFEGLGEAITAVDNFFRFRKKRAETEILEHRSKLEGIKTQKEAIELQENQINLQLIKSQSKLELDSSITEAERVAKLRNIDLDYKERIEDLRQKRIENDLKQLQLMKDYKTVAEEFLAPYIPQEMPLDKKIEAIVSIIPSLQQIETSNLELHKGRPDTLPEFPLSNPDNYSRPANLPEEK